MRRTVRTNIDSYLRPKSTYEHKNRYNEHVVLGSLSGLQWKRERRGAAMRDLNKIEISGFDSRVIFRRHELPQASCAVASEWFAEGVPVSLSFVTPSVTMSCPPVVLLAEQMDGLATLLEHLEAQPAVTLDEHGLAADDSQDCGAESEAGQGNGWSGFGHIAIRRLSRLDADWWEVRIAQRVPMACGNMSHWPQQAVMIQKSDAKDLVRRLRMWADSADTVLPQPMTWKLPGSAAHLPYWDSAANVRGHRDDAGQPLLSNGEGACFLFQVGGFPWSHSVQLMGLEPSIVSATRWGGRLLLSCRTFWDDRMNLPVRLAGRLTQLASQARIEAVVGASDRSFVDMVAGEVGMDSDLLAPLVALEAARLANAGFDLRRLRALSQGNPCAFPDLPHIEGDSFLDEIINASRADLLTAWQACPAPTRAPLHCQPLSAFGG